jgi:hypothetical protein
MLASQWPKARICSTMLPPIKLVSSAVRAGAGTVSSPDPAKAPPAAAGQLTQGGLWPVMLSLAAQAALRFNAATVVTGCSAHADGTLLGFPGPEAGPDALREAIHAFEIMLESMLRPRARLAVESPLMDLTYPQILKLGQRFGVPWQRTHTCESPAAGPCGKCNACSHRSRAFQEAGLVDPAAAAVVTASRTLTAS